MIGRPPKSPLFPYTPLSRSEQRVGRPPARGQLDSDHPRPETAHDLSPGMRGVVRVDGHVAADAVGVLARQRSEEHTSELQSQSNLVCRLLLEKKKHITSTEVPAQPSRTSSNLSCPPFARRCGRGSSGASVIYDQAPTVLAPVLSCQAHRAHRV